MRISSIISWIKAFCINIIDIILPKSKEILLLERKTIIEWRELSNIIERDNIISFLPYQNKDVRQAVWEIKYKGNKIIKAALGDIAVEYLLEEIAEKSEFENFLFPIVTGIPISKKRMRDRGFNQSEDIGKYIAGRLNLPFQMMLTKSKETARQTTLKRASRILNVKNSFKVRPDILKTLKGKNIILFDDVFTTGSTMNEAKKMLLSGGAKKVLCFTLAH